MKTKKTKSTKQEIAYALDLLTKHNIVSITLADCDFADEWLKDEWKRVGIEPTASDLRRAKEKTLEYLQNEQGQMMHDAIEYIAMRKSTK